jgi:hypothetical protein
MTEPLSASQRADPFARPPGIVFNGVAAAMFAVAVWRGSERTGVLDSALLVAAVWFFVLLLWLFRCAAGAGAGTITLRSAARWGLAPSLFVVAAVLAFNDVAMEARFALSRGALDGAVEAALAGEDVSAGWVGLYPVEGVSITDGSIRIAIDGQYAFVRDAPGGSDSVIWYEPMGGRWSMEIDASFGD